MNASPSQWSLYWDVPRRILSQTNPVELERTRARTHSLDIWPISHRLLCYFRLSGSSFVFPLRNQFDTCLNSQLKALFCIWVTAAVT